MVMSNEKKRQLMMDGPIPGENYTSDTRNYPWHKPPKHKDTDSAIERTINEFFDKTRSQKLVTALEMGVSVATLTDIYLTTGISKGRWTPDFALLLAGPVAHILKMMAEGYGIDYNMGIEKDEVMKSSTFFTEKGRLSNIKYSPPKRLKEEVKQEVASGGLASVDLTEVM